MPAETEEDDQQDEGQEDAQAQQAEAPPPKPSLLKNKKVIIGLAAVVVVVIVAVAVLVFWPDKKEDVAARVAAATGGNRIFYDLPPMLVNINTAGVGNVYLKVQVALELSSQADQQRVEAVMPRIVDSFQMYLRELRPEELQGSAGMYRLKEELMDRINRAIFPAQINDVLFKEMLVQ